MTTAHLARGGLYVLLIATLIDEAVCAALSLVESPLNVAAYFASGALAAVLLAWIVGWTWWWNR